MLTPDVKYPIEKVTKTVIFLKNFITNPLIQVGDYTYYDGRGKGEQFETENVVIIHSCRLIIGKFCQLAYGTKFIMSDANHDMRGFSTFPFFIFGRNNEHCPEWNVRIPEKGKGDTVVGNDVWFGHESIVLGGVRIGDGAIIGARAVVTKDVPPYSVVGGNPARLIRQRFSDDVIERLLILQWWNWDYKTITAHIPEIIGGDIDKLERVTPS